MNSFETMTVLLVLVKSKFSFLAEKSRGDVTFAFIIYHKSKTLLATH